MVTQCLTIVCNFLMQPVKSNELLEVKRQLSDIRSQNEEFERRAIQTQTKQEREKFRTKLEKISFDTETPSTLLQETLLPHRNIKICYQTKR